MLSPPFERDRELKGEELKILQIDINSNLTHLDFGTALTVKDKNEHHREVEPSFSLGKNRFCVSEINRMCISNPEQKQKEVHHPPGQWFTHWFIRFVHQQPPSRCNYLKSHYTL